MYKDELWHGLIGKNLFFAPFKSELNYVLYYVSMEDLIARAIDLNLKGNSKGTLLSRF